MILVRAEVMNVDRMTPERGRKRKLFKFPNCSTRVDDTLETTTPQQQQQQQITPTPSARQGKKYPVQELTKTTASHSSIQTQQLMDEEPPTSLIPDRRTETLPGMDSPIIPRTVDLDTISQQEANSYVAVAADHFVDYFVEGISPTSNVLRANERVGPVGEFKVLVACNVTSDVWERRFADFDYDYNDRVRPRPRLEMHNDCVYIFNVPSRTHRNVQFEVFAVLRNAMVASGIPQSLWDVRAELSGDYSNTTNNETVNMQPDIVISANNRTIAVLEIEITHRSVPTLRAHAQRIFNGDGDVIIVAVLKVHTRRSADRSFAAEFVAWRRGDDGIIQCLPACVHDFGTGVSDPQAINTWSQVRHNALDTAVPQHVHFIQQEHRADGEQREPLVLPVVDALRVALNGDYATDEVEDCSIDLTRIVSLVERALP